MNSPRKLATYLCDLFNRGCYLEVLEYTARNKPSEKSLKRICLHYEAMVLAVKGSTHKAKFLLEQASNYGENVQVLRDLCCCYYQMGEVDKWRESYNQLKSLLKKYDKKLTGSAKLSCNLILGKFLEEEGHIAQALDIYYQLIEQPLNIKTPSYYQVASQILRLKSQQTPDQELSSLYTSLLATSDKTISDYLDIEIEHSLMVAELVLIGPRHALVRASKIIKDPNISELDKRLFYFDFIEECLMNGYALPEQFKEWGKALLSGAQLYEQEVYDLAFNEKNGLDHYNGLAKKLPLASYLRILILKLSQLSLGSEDKKELRKKLNLMISSLGEKDRNFWFRKIESIEMGLEVDLLLNERTKNIMFQRRQLDLSRKNISFQILQLLGQRATWDVEAVIESIWQSNYSIEHLNRLRMSVRRTNQLLCSLTENEKCIDLSGNSLSLKPNIKILSQRMDN